MKKSTHRMSYDFIAFRTSISAEIKSCFIQSLYLLISLTLAGTAQSAVIFADSFDSGTLDPAWVVTGTPVIASNSLVADNNNFTITYSADLTGYENITLSYDWWDQFGNTGEEIVVQGNDGGGWATLAIHDANTVPSLVIQNELISFVPEGVWSNAGFGIRFSLSSNSVNDFIYLDNIVLSGNAVPIPAAAWLFGSGLLGLVGMARRKKAA